MDPDAVTTRESQARLAKAIRERMSQLGLRGPSDVYAAGGPAPTTLREMLRAEDPDAPDQFREWWPQSLLKIDAAMKWAPNSARNVLAGGEPQLRPATAVDTTSGTAAAGARTVRINGFEMVIDADVELSATDLQALETAARDIVARRLLEIRESRRRES